MAPMTDSNFWMCIGVCLGWVLGVCTVLAVWWRDRLAARELHNLDQERCDCPICRGETRHGDAVTHDDTYPGGIRP